jgi:hypothetical protein
MSALHHIRDICELDGPTFFRIAYRLPAYEGAARVDLEGWLEEAQEQERQFIEQRDNEGLPPRYIYDEADMMREKEGRLNVPMPTADRAATLEELAQAGVAMPQIGQIAPVFEMPTVTD